MNIRNVNCENVECPMKLRERKKKRYKGKTFGYTNTELRLKYHRTTYQKLNIMESNHLKILTIDEKRNQFIYIFY